MDNLELNIKLANENDKQDWDRYVLSKNEASPYHLFAWKLAIEEALGHKGYYLIAKQGNSVKGIFPLIRLKLPLFINELIALPYCDVGAMLYNNDLVGRALLNEGVKLCQKLRIKKTQIRGDLNLTALNSNRITHEKQNKVRMFLNLPESSDLLFKSFKSKLRSQIRKAEKNGLTFSWADDTAINDYYAVFSRNMRDLGSPVHSKLLFKRILVNYGDNAKLGVVKYQGVSVGACIILQVGSNISIPWASTSRKYNKLAPNMLLYWNVLKYSSDSGCKTFDFGRSTKGEGTYKFKKQWGATPLPLNWYSLSATNSIIDLDIDGHSAKKKEFISWMWQKLPLPLANFLGPKIRKYINL